MNAHTRKPTNLSLDRTLLEEARALDVNLSRAAEDGLRAAVKAEKERQWKEENRDVIKAWTAWHDKNGLLLEKYRQF
jgi:antitoxin CcdA